LPSDVSSTAPATSVTTPLTVPSNRLEIPTTHHPDE
jgi:hypothetical protein